MSQLRMKDLVAQTGASREAIRFYINEGLVPEPRKTSRNMAWYSKAHVARVRYIRALQEEHFLPLKAIRAVLDGQGHQQFSDHQLRQFDALRQQIESEHAGEQRRQLAEVAAELSLTDEECEAARQMGFVNDDGSMGPQDEELVRLWVQNRELGLSPERGFGPRDMQCIQDAVNLVFAAELQMFTQRLQDADEKEVARLFDGVIPNVNRAFVLLHERKLRQFFNQTSRPKSATGDPQEGDSR